MAKQQSYDPTEFSRIQEHCADLESQYGQRKTMFEAIENMFLMDWSDKPDREELKLTISPQARNTALGAIRLLTAADPVFTVPYDKKQQSAKKQADLLERVADAMWKASGRIRQCPVHYDAVSSAVLFGEMHIGVVPTADLVEHAKGPGKETPLSKAAVKRAEQVAAITPYLFESYDPRSGYPEYDALGLTSYFRKVTMKSGTVLDRWGEKAIEAGLSVSDRFEDVEYCDYWDTIYHVVWLEGKGTPMLMAEHGLPIIPIVAQITDGSMIHEKLEHQRQPFLYTLWKSGLWERQSLELTVIYTMVNALANNPMFMYQAVNDEKSLMVDNSIPGGVVRLVSGEQFGSLAKNILDTNVVNALDIATKLGQESTLYETALGAPLGGNQPYSTVALLNQAGRLPLTSIQRRGGWGIAKAVEIAFMLARDSGVKNSVHSERGMLDLKASDIPENVSVECKLDVSLPTDDRQNALVALQLSGGDNPLLSKATVRERYLNSGQSDLEESEIYAEKMATLIAQAKFQQEVQRIMQQVQQQQGQPTGATQQQQMTAQQAQQMAQQAGMPGQQMPMTEPIQQGGEQLPGAMGGAPTREV
jgi:hypothetical protein